jgi:hypothetical protein
MPDAGLKPSGAGTLFRICGESERRRPSSTRPLSGSISGADSLAGTPTIISGGTCARTARTARMRRRSQRTALGKVTSHPRSASAAASMLLAEAATVMLSSIAASRPDSPTARKSGSRLNVRCPSGQYHRAIRTPRGVTRA